MDTRQFNEIRSLLIEIRDSLLSIAKQPGELLTPEEVCVMGKISRSTYGRLVNERIINQIRLKPGKNTKVYVLRSEVERLIEEGKI